MVLRSPYPEAIPDLRRPDPKRFSGDASHSSQGLQLSPTPSHATGITLFSLTVEYALRAVVFLASKAPSAITTQEIAEVTKVPQAYLSKVIQGLCRAGVLKSQRGVGGGVRLVGEPKQVSILKIVNAVDPVQRIRTCPLKLQKHEGKMCSLHTRMDNVLAHTEDVFRGTTLDEVLADLDGSLPLCGDHAGDSAKSTGKSPSANSK